MTHFFCFMCFSSVAAYCGTNYLWYLWNNILQFMYVFFWWSIWGVSIFVVLDNIALNHNSHVLLVGMKTSTITLEDIFMFFKLTMHLAHDPIILLLGIYKRETKTYVHTNACIWSFMALVKFIMAKNWEQPKKPTTHEYINNSWHSHRMKYCSAPRRKNILMWTTTLKNLKCFMPRENSQTQLTTY